MPECIIELNRITKTYKGKPAVREVDLKLYKGEIFGLIGQNGAGKSTLLKMIGGLVHPTSGSIRFFNCSPEESRGFHERMGLLVEHAGLYPQYSAYGNMNLLAAAYGIKDRKPFLTGLLELVGLEADSKKKVKHFSMGMKQRLGIAIALLGSPDVLILDEPINGLDPQGIVEVRNLILELNQKGLTIIISSHFLEELSKIATKYGFIHEGSMIEVLSRDELLERCEERLELEVDEARAALPILEKELHIVRYKAVSDRLLYIYDKHAELKDIIRVLVNSGVEVHSAFRHKQSLEQYFLERTQGGGGGHG